MATETQTARPEMLKQATRSRTERVDLRVSAELKDLIERAAALVGQSLSSFVLGTMIPHAREVIRSADTLTLSDRDRDRFLAAIEDTESEPNDALKRAAKRYKAAINRP